MQIHIFFQKPATYSCLVQDEVAATEVSIQVDVIDRAVVHTCHGEKHMNILWPETAPGTQSVQECPKGFTGVVRRWCVLHDFEKSVWQLPDFSMCTADFLTRINANVSLLQNFLMSTLLLIIIILNYSFNDYI